MLLNIEVVESRIKTGTIDNIPAYLMKAFKDNFIPIQTKHDKQKALKAEQKQIASEQAEQKKQQIKDLEKQFNQKKAAKVHEHINGLEERQLSNLKQQFLESMKQKPVLNPEVSGLIVK